VFQYSLAAVAEFIFVCPKVCHFFYLPCYTREIITSAVTCSDHVKAENVASLIPSSIEVFKYFPKPPLNLTLYSDAVSKATVALFQCRKIITQIAPCNYSAN
jgi:hypothetical protein